MSDFERNKFPFKKKFQSRGESSSSFGSRFFNSKSGGKDEKSDSKSKSMKQPTILIKSRDHMQEERDSSTKTVIKESESAPSITIATPSHSESTPQLLPQQAKGMKKSAKLLENGMIYPENLQDYILQENNDFLVIGIVGTQSVGKSTILNLLAQNRITSDLCRAMLNPTNKTDKDEDFLGNFSAMNIDMPEEIFKTESLASGYNGTSGVDVYITPNRVMLLDSQPFSSEAVLHDFLESDNSKMSNLGSEFMSSDVSCEIQSLQQTAFLMSVCHILILAQDWFFDSNVLRYILTAEMLKPTISNPEDEFIDHFPHLILLHNKAQMGDFSPQRFKRIQEIYRSIFSKTKMHIESGMGIGTGRVLHSLSPDNCGESINLYLIPEFDDDTELPYKGHPPFEDLIARLRSNILGATKLQLTHVQLNEKNWLVYCSKVWDHVKKSSFFVEYAKLLP